MIRPKTIKSAAHQAVLHAIRDGRKTEIWIDNREDTNKYVVKSSHNDEPALYDGDFVAAVEPKTPPGRVEIEQAEVQATWEE